MPQDCVDILFSNKKKDPGYSGIVTMKLHRRDFLAGIIGSTLALHTSRSFAFAGRTLPEPAKAPALRPACVERGDGVILPHALREGSTIGIIAPASGVSMRELDDGVATLKSWGCKVELGKAISKGNGYLAASDEARATEFMEFIKRPDIDAIICARGGYGVMRILPMLDFDVIRSNPKIIVGYSDITALVNAVYSRSRVVAFHGPVASSTFNTFTKDYFYNTLFTNTPLGEIADSQEFDAIDFSESKLKVLHEGTCKGRLVGGNLTLVVSTLGTPYEIDTTDAILFLEEVSEEPYKIDRMLTQLWLAGKLQTCKGIALGRFKDCERLRNPDFKVSFSLEQVLRERISSLGIPAVYGLPIGHIKSKMTVPIGTMASLDAEKGKLSILEPSVTM